MNSKAVKISLITLGCVVLLVAGAAGGYFYATETHRSDEPDRAEGATAAEQAATKERKSMLAMTGEVCVAATELRSAYTRKVVGHSERCRVSPAAEASDDGRRSAALLGVICTDVRKATRTAHLPDADCPGTAVGESVGDADRGDKAANATARKPERARKP